LRRSSSTTSPTPRVRVPQHVVRLVTRLACAARRRLLHLRCTSGCLGTSRDSLRGLSSTTSTTPRVRVSQHVARLLMRLATPIVVDYFAYAVCPDASARRRLLRLRRASGCLGTSRGSSLTTSTMSHVRVPRHVARLLTRLVVDYFTYAARPVASACRVACRVTHRRLLRLRRAFGCLGTSRGSSRGSASTTSATPRVWVPQHVARLITRLAYAAHRQLLRLRRASGYLCMSHDSSPGSSSTTSPTPRVRMPRLVVDYFAYTARPGASTCRAARRRLLRLARLVARHVVRLVVDYFAYTARPGASAPRAACHAARHAARHRVLCLAQARRRLLRLCRASGCLVTPRGSSRRSSSTTSPTPRIRVPRHVARLVARLVVDYSVRRDFVLRPHWLYFSHAVHRDYLPRGNTGSASSTPRAAVMSSSGCIASAIHLD
jgi:hypothetical protein